MQNKNAGWRIAGGRIAVRVTEDTTWVAGEDTVDTLLGPAAQLALLLNDTQSEEELTRLAAGIPAWRELLESLRQAGLAEYSAQSREIRLDASGLKLGGALAWRPLTRIGADLLGQLLEASKVTIDENAGRLLVTTDDYLSPAVLEIARTEQRPWMLARPLGRTLLIGPVFDPGNTCWFCLAHWLRTRRWTQAARTGWADHACPAQPAIAAAPGMTAAAAGFLTTMVLQWLQGSLHLAGAFHCLNLLDGSGSRYPLIPRPGCRCSTAPPVPLSYWTNPLTGLVFDLQRTAQPVAGFWQAQAQHYRPLPLPGARPLLRPGEVYGSGSTPEEAETRCIAEGLERYCSIWQGGEETVTAAMHELDAAIHPNELTQFSPRQYRTREDWNRRYPPLFHVAEELDVRRPLQWVRVRSLLDGSFRFAPAACIHMWHTTPAGTNFGIADSNGCAAGRTPEEAALGGLLELIERDAVAIWWYNQLQRPQVDWAAWGDPSMVRAAETLREQGRRAVLLDLTHDFGIPVYAAVSTREDGARPYAGCAAHLDAATAARKAFSELIQNWFWSSHDAHSEAQDAWLRDTSGSPFLQPCGAAPPGPAFRASAAEAVQCCVERLVERGVHPFIADLTRAEIGLPVVRVIAPGLRHCWMRFAPGRLYEVPVSLGWLPGPLAEDAMNPLGCPL